MEGEGWVPVCEGVEGRDTTPQPPFGVFQLFYQTLGAVGKEEAPTAVFSPAFYRPTL